MILLVLDDFEDADGRPRLKSALSMTSARDTAVRNEIMEIVLIFGHKLERSHRNEFSNLICDSFPDLEPAWLYRHLEDDHSLALALGKAIGRIDIIKERLHA
jgi:hypothetical protein